MVRYISAVVAAFALCLAAAHFVHRRAAREQLARDLQSVHENLIRRGRATRTRALAILDDLQFAPADPQDLQQALRQGEFVRNAVALDGGGPFVDAFGRIDEGFRLGEPSAVVGTDIRLWFRPEGLWVAKGDRAIVIDRTFLVEAVLPEGMGAALLDTRNGLLLAERHAGGARWLSAGQAAGLVDGTDVVNTHGYLVVCDRLTPWPLRLMVLAPKTMVATRAGQTSPVFWSVGAVGAVLLAGLAVTALRQRSSLAGELADAIEQRNLTMVYQPLVRVRKGGVVAGIEALARWRTEAGEDIRPDVFIELADRIGRLHDLVRCIIDRICDDLRDVLTERKQCYVAINFVGSELADDGLMAYIEQRLDDVGIERGQVMIELTERMIGDGTAAGALHTLRQRGYRISIDDYGTGGQPTEKLAALEPDLVKIDRTFVTLSDSDGPPSTLLNQLIHMARSSGATVVVEGVETDRQARRVHRIGADCAQGFYWSQPVPPSAVPALFSHN